MAMKITNKSEMKVRQYAEHIVHEKEIMATVNHSKLLTQKLNNNKHLKGSSTPIHCGLIFYFPNTK